MRVTLKQLNVFREVFETGQISKAARSLSLSVSAVSQSLTELESSLDVTLFVRTTQGLQPSPAGKVLYPRAVMILRDVEDVEKLMHAQEAGLAGTLKIGSNRNFGIYVLSRRLPQFQLKRPSIQVQFYVEDNAKILSGVRDNTLDLGFVSEPPSDPDLEAFVCFRERHCIVTSAASSLPRLDMTMSDLSAAPWIMEEEMQAQTLRWLKSHSVTVAHCITMNQKGAIKRAIATGFGVARLSYLSVSEELRRGELIELFKEVSQDGQDDSLVYAVYKPEHTKRLREVLFKDCDIKPITLPENQSFIDE